MTGLLEQVRALGEVGLGRRDRDLGRAGLLSGIRTAVDDVTARLAIR